MQSKTKRFEAIFKEFPFRGRFQFFLLFVLLSFSFWVSTKLSNTYQVDQDFEVVWSSPPRDIILSDYTAKINLSITASGIEILWYRLFKNKINLELKKTDFTIAMGKVSIEKQRFSIRQFLFDNTELNAINTEDLQVKFSRLASKKIKVYPQATIKMRPGYLSVSQIICIPDSVLVMGSESVLDTLFQIHTAPFVLNDAHEDFSKRLNLKSIDAVQFDVDSVYIRQTITRYSEKEFIIPIEIINLPNNIRLKLFPPTAKIKAILPLTLYNGIKDSDFILAVDYNQILEKQTTQLTLSLIKQPSQIKKVTWEPKKVNYLIRK